METMYKLTIIANSEAEAKEIAIKEDKRVRHVVDVKEVRKVFEVMVVCKGEMVEKNFK